MSQIVLLIHRFNHLLYLLKVPFIPKVFAQLTRLVFSCYIGPGAKIGKSVTLGYGGLATIIHGRAEIGYKVQVGAGVTIGGRSKLDELPVIGDCCVIGGGAKILGPIKIGSKSVVGANAVVVDDVPNHCVVAGVPAKVIKRDINISDYHDAITPDMEL